MRLLTDTDPGLDDAIALCVALGTPGVDIAGVTTVGGNTRLANTTRNALRLLELVGRSDIPVAAGFDVPYRRQRRDLEALVHGADGFAGVDLPDPVTEPVSDDAPAFLAEAIRLATEPVTLVTLGPLTNIAHMLDRFPDAIPARTVVMGGAARLGNVTPVAEFNVWHDPEAAQRVFRSELHPVMVGLDATHSVKTMESEWAWLAGAGQFGAVIAQMMSFYTDFYASVHGERMSHQHDAMAMVEAIQPGFLEQQDAAIDVEVHGDLTVGMTVVDVRGPATARVAWRADADRFHAVVRTALANLAQRA